MSVTVKIDTAVLDNIMRNLDMNTNEAIGAVAFELEREVKVQIQAMKIWKTGNYHNSIKASPQTKKVWWVHDQTDYGVYQELGHHNVPARPAFAAAVEITAQRLTEKFKRLFP